MKTGKSLQELAAEIERQQNAKRDLVANTKNLRFAQIEENTNGLAVGLREIFQINDIAHQQIGEHVQIPKPYYDRMRRDAPDLLATNVNRWFEQYPAPRMIRTLDGKARAFLSDRYRPLEHADLAEAVMPVLLQLNLEIMSCEITDRRMYIKAVDQRIKQDVPSGRKIGDGSHVFFDTVSPAIIISNSEVGYGQLAVDYGVFTKVCTNLATIAKEGMRRTHVGGRNELTDNLQAMLSDETRRAKDKALWLEVRDTVKLAFDEARFQAHADKLRGMSERKIEGDVVKVVSFATKKFGLNETEGDSVLKRMIEGGDLTQYGLFNAVTRTAQDLEYDRATELEYLGGKIIDLPANDWRELARAA